jgi:hypothetical protein
VKLIKTLDAEKNSLVYLWLLNALLNQRRHLSKVSDFNTVYELAAKFFIGF